MGWVRIQGANAESGYHGAEVSSGFHSSYMCMSFPGGSEVKASACNAGDLGSIPGSAGSPGDGNGNPLQYSCLENPMDGGAWWATVSPRVAESDTTERLYFHFHFTHV